MSYTGGELERQQPSRPAPYLRGHQTVGGEYSVVVDWPEAATLVRGRVITGIGVVLIVVSLIWKAFFLNHYYFWQDDFHFIELSLSMPLDYHYLTFVGAGHMFPALYFIVWVWARASLYNWAVASAITMIMLAASGLAALRLLRTLFGSRPAILVLLVLYLVSPLTMPDIRWWSAAVETVPLQLAIFMALNAQVHYVRTRRFRHALAALAWLIVGLLFFEKALVMPVLLFLFTSGFLMEGPWLQSAWRCLVRYWPSWLLQVVTLGVYAVVLKNALKTSSVQPGVPTKPGNLLTFTWDLLVDSLIPGITGGPWRWFPQTAPGGAEYAYANPPTALIGLSVIVVACVIGASIWARRYAWRAWAIVAVWFIGADVVPIALGRVADLTPGGAALLGLETRYVSDVPAVLIVCVGLAFLPVDGRPDIRRRSHLSLAQGFSTQPARMVGATLVSAFLIGSVFSVQSFVANTTSLPNKIFLQNAQIAVDEAPAGTVVLNQRVPENVMLGIFRLNALESRLVGTMESPADRARITWISTPRGTFDRLMVMGNDGRLHIAAIYGRTGMPIPSGARQCYPPSKGRIAIPFTEKTFSGSDVLRVDYIASGAQAGKDITVTYGLNSQQVPLKAGLHSFYLPERGSVGSVTFSGPAVTGPAVCIGGIDAGIIVPSPSGETIPSTF